MICSFGSEWNQLADNQGVIIYITRLNPFHCLHNSRPVNQAISCDINFQINLIRDLLVGGLGWESRVHVNGVKQSASLDECRGRLEKKSLTKKTKNNGLVGKVVERQKPRKKKKRNARRTPNEKNVCGWRRRELSKGKRICPKAADY